MVMLLWETVALDQPNLFAALIAAHLRMQARCATQPTTSPATLLARQLPLVQAQDLRKRGGSAREAPGLQ
jgi:hypothetical protein